MFPGVDVSDMLIVPTCQVSPCLSHPLPVRTRRSPEEGKKQKRQKPRLRKKNLVGTVPTHACSHTSRERTHRGTSHAATQLSSHTMTRTLTRTREPPHIH